MLFLFIKKLVSLLPPAISISNVPELVNNNLLLVKLSINKAFPSVSELPLTINLESFKLTVVPNNKFPFTKLKLTSSAQSEF